MPPNALHRAAAIALFGLGLAACAPTVDQRGNLPDDQRLAQIQPGVTTKDNVAKLLGTPSTVSTFDPNTWYYISQRTEQTAFFNPALLDQQVVIVAFDDQGVVRVVRHRGLEDGKEIEPIARATPAPGRELSFFEQLLGNLGRFNTDDKKGPGGGNRPGS
jgi:outer membrane protein assembly factor BamE (lipoprotein component of BamABCDE complex)